MVSRRAARRSARSPETNHPGPVVRVSSRYLLILLRRVVVGRVPDTLERKIDVNRELDPAHPGDPVRGHEHPLAERPVARLDDQAAQRPRLVVDEESADVTDVAVDRRDPVGADQTRALETRVALSPAGGLRRSAALRTRSPEESAGRPGVRHRVAPP